MKEARRGSRKRARCADHPDPRRLATAANRLAPFRKRRTHPCGGRHRPRAEPRRCSAHSANSQSRRATLSLPSRSLRSTLYRCHSNSSTTVGTSSSAGCHHPSHRQYLRASSPRRAWCTWLLCPTSGLRSAERSAGLHARHGPGAAKAPDAARLGRSRPSQRERERRRRRARTWPWARGGSGGSARRPGGGLGTAARRAAAAAASAARGLRPGTRSVGEHGAAVRVWVLPPLRRLARAALAAGNPPACSAAPRAAAAAVEGSGARARVAMHWSSHDESTTCSSCGGGPGPDCGASPTWCCCREPGCGGAADGALGAGSSSAGALGGRAAAAAVAVSEPGGVEEEGAPAPRGCCCSPPLPRSALAWSSSDSACPGPTTTCVHRAEGAGPVTATPPSCATAAASVLPRSLTCGMLGCSHSTQPCIGPGVAVGGAGGCAGAAPWGPCLRRGWAEDGAGDDGGAAAACVGAAWASALSTLRAARWSCRARLLLLVGCWEACTSACVPPVLACCSVWGGTRALLRDDGVEARGAAPAGPSMEWPPLCCLAPPSLRCWLASGAAGPLVAVGCIPSSQPHL